MTAVVEAVTSVVSSVGDAVGSVVQSVVHVADQVLTHVVQPVAEAVTKVVEKAAEDPAKTIATIAAVATGNPQLIPLINATATVAQGGSLEDGLKAAAISYVAAEIGANVGSYGDQIGAAAEYGTQVGSQQTAMLAAQNAGMGTIGDIAGNVIGGTASGAARGVDPLEALPLAGLNAFRAARWRLRRRHASQYRRWWIGCNRCLRVPECTYASCPNICAPSGSTSTT